MRVWCSCVVFVLCVHAGVCLCVCVVFVCVCCVCVYVCLCLCLWLCLCVRVKNKWMHKGCNRDDTSEYIFQGLAYFDTFGSSPQYFADRAVTLRRFGTAFLLLFIGIFLSASILVGEIFYAKRRGTAVSAWARGRDRAPRCWLGEQWLCS